MSYILNALRKSEQERQQNRERNLAAQLRHDNGANRRGHGRWLIPLLVLNAALLGYVVIGRYNQDPPEPAPESAKQRIDPVRESKRVETLPTLALPTETEIVAAAAAPVSEPATIAGMVKNNKNQSLEAGSEIVEKRTAAKAKSDRETALAPGDREHPMARKQTLDNGETTAKQSARSPELAVAPADVNDKGKPDQEVLNKEDGLPWLDELPASFRRNVPQLEINVYVYSDSEENRFIMVSMRKHRIGQEIASGMLLRDIQPDGIVVEYRGKRFKIRRS